MAALTFTAASVLLSGGLKQNMIAGATVARGKLLRLNTSNQVIPAVNDSAANAAAKYVALADADSGQDVPVAVLANGGVLAGVASGGGVGKALALGAAGAFIPVDDIAAGVFTTIVGIQLTASTIQLGSIVGGVAAAADVT